jgi:hypothetical protein
MVWYCEIRGYLDLFIDSWNSAEAAQYDVG